MNLKPHFLSIALAVVSAPAFAAEQTVTLSVPGMTCASCPFIVQAAISGVDGVQSVETSLETLTAVVVFDDAVATVDDITFATLSAGYESSLIESGSDS